MSPAELFGFYVYELRVGHTDRIWCTAQGRFGHPTRVNGVQHPGAAAEVPGGPNAGWHSGDRAVRASDLRWKECHQQAAQDRDLVHALRPGQAGRRRAEPQHSAGRDEGGVCGHSASGCCFLPARTLRHAAATRQQHERFPGRCRRPARRSGPKTRFCNFWTSSIYPAPLA